MHCLYANFLLTATALAATPSSFGQWVFEFPMCAWSCLDNYFNEQLASKCGPNAKFSMTASDVECICTADNSSLQMSQSANELTTCLSSQCAASRDARGFEQAVGDSMYQLIDQLVRGWKGVC